MSGGQTYELDERAIAAIHNENSGNRYHRMNVIRERGIEAVFQAAETPVALCPFKNHNGWCKLSEGHKGKHTVIWLGNDDE